MPKIDKEKLDNLLKEAGIGERTAKKLHKANGTDESSTTPLKPKGHGAAFEQRQPIGDL